MLYIHIAEYPYSIVEDWMPDDISRQVQATVRVWRESAGLNYADAAAQIGVSVGLLHAFLSAPDPKLGRQIWRALYRNLPELRWLLEEYQRQAALRPEVTSTGPLRRVSA